MQSGADMRTIIYYYTSTGNSLWVARGLARELGNTEVKSMIGWDGQELTGDPPAIGLVFPVHIWGVPLRVLDFLEKLPAAKNRYLFAVAVNAGQVSNTLVQLQQVLTSRGSSLSAGWSIVLPSNYIPWGGPGSQEKQNKLFTAAHRKIAAIAPAIQNGISMPVEKGPLWQRIVFTWLYYLSTPHIHEMDKNFWVDERCNRCGICEKVCPSNNIIIDDGRLTWHNRCEHCLACLQWCPQEALQYGRKTPRYDRYHHPEVTLKDML